MTDEHTNPQLPATIADVIAGISQALVPRSLKALDRLVGGVIDIPVAKLAQYKAKIDAQSQSYAMVEKAIANAAAVEAEADTEVVQQAVNILVRKEYRRLLNKQSVGQAMLEDLREVHSATATPDAQPEVPPVGELDEDWLNVFERYAEDATTERMQKLWGRVLAGEVRKPGKYSTRTLRFLSEFSQSEALEFAKFCNSAFGDLAPTALVKPNEQSDIRHLLDLEAAGLITGAGGFGPQISLTMNEQGFSFLRENDLALVLKGEPGVEVKLPAIMITPIGKELVDLIPGRDARAAARKVGLALRCEQIRSAVVAVVVEGGNAAKPLETLWDEGT